MLKRLLSTGVALAVVLGGGVIAMEAMGLLRSSPAVSGQRRIDAIVAYIDATFDTRDLPSEAEADGLSPPSAEHAEQDAKAPSKEHLKVLTAETTASGPPPVGDRQDADAAPTTAAGDAGRVRLVAGSGGSDGGLKTGPKAPPEATEVGRALLDPSPQPKLVAAVETTPTAPAPQKGGAQRPSGAKGCRGACNAKSPPQRRAPLWRTSEAATCALWGGGQVDSAGAGHGALPAIRCPVALLP